jgi:tRNA C32,U32 (ribose-2'-O)-methylase TrmJ
MNLGQAAAVCFYEIAARADAAAAAGSEGPHPIRKNKSPAKAAHPESDETGDTGGPASMRDLELLAGVVEEAMAAANYSPAAMRGANRHDLHLLLRRLALTRRDARRVLGVFRRILWQLEHPKKGKREMTPGA